MGLFLSQEDKTHANEYCKNRETYSATVDAYATAHFSAMFKARQSGFFKAFMIVSVAHVCRYLKVEVDSLDNQTVNMYQTVLERFSLALSHVSIWF
jgi:predicted nucleic acid-binding protein